MDAVTPKTESRADQHSHIVRPAAMEWQKTRYRDRTVRGDGMELLRYEQVEVLVVFFQGGKAVGVPTDKKGRSQRVIAGGNLPDARYACVNACACRRKRPLWLLTCVIGRARVRQ